MLERLELPATDVVVTAYGCNTEMTDCLVRAQVRERVDAGLPVAFTDEVRAGRVVVDKEVLCTLTT